MHGLQIISVQAVPMFTLAMVVALAEFLDPLQGKVLP
jgi:hypothetical protein